MSIKRFLVSTIGAGALTVGGVATAAPAPAEPVFQEGLVNVNIQDVTVQVPVAVALNLCDVNVAVLADVIDQAGSCDAVAESDAESHGNQGGGPVAQSGLVNVNVSGVIIQVPAAVAANICDVNVAVLAELVDSADSCDAHAGSQAGA